MTGQPVVRCVCGGTRTATPDELAIAMLDPDAPAPVATHCGTCRPG